MYEFTFKLPARVPVDPEVKKLQKNNISELFCLFSPDSDSDSRLKRRPEGNLEARDAWCGGTAHAQGHPLINTSGSFLLRTPIYRVSWNLATRKRLRIFCLIGYLWPEGIYSFSSFGQRASAMTVKRSRPRQTGAQGGRSASHLYIIALATLAGVCNAHLPERRLHEARQAQLTPPTVSLTDPTSSLTGSVSILPIVTTTTALTTSIGPVSTCFHLFVASTFLCAGIPSRIGTHFVRAPTVRHWQVFSV